jgi:uncharacterized membrane protein
MNAKKRGISSRQEALVKRREIIVLSGIMILALGILIYMVPEFKDASANEWNMHGEDEAFSPKVLGLFSIPFVYIGLIILFIIIPLIAPLKSDIKSVKNYYYAFMIIITIILVYVHILNMIWSVERHISKLQLISPALGMLFYYMGLTLPHLEKNHLFGIRTRWTMKSLSVWRKTHDMGGMLFKACGLVAIAGVALPEWWFKTIVYLVLATMLYLIYYSYKEYQKQS